MSRTNLTFLRRHILETKVSKAPSYRAAFDFLDRQDPAGSSRSETGIQSPIFFEGW